MRRQRGLIGLMGLAALIGLGMMARTADAKVTTEKSASILVFPKVVADGTRDTIIQITNTSNSMRHAHCFYVNGAPRTASLPAGPNNPPLWTEIDFDIWLTKQQPTHWVVSQGRLDNPGDSPCTRPITGDNCKGTTPLNDKNSGGTDADCCDAGFDPGRVPPVVPYFTGELKCIEVDASGIPIPGDSLKGEATLETLATGDISKYNAIGLTGFDTNTMDGVLCLGGDVSTQCPQGAEYQACPLGWIVDHTSGGAMLPAMYSGVNVTGTTSLTVVPCTQNYETQAPTSVTIQFLLTNEYEITFSASTTVTCWATYELGQPAVPGTNPFGGINDIFNAANNGGAVLKTTIRSAAGTTPGAPKGIMVVSEENLALKATPATVAKAAFNDHTTFEDQPGSDIITVPAEQIGN